ncbi:DUF559 domain-containing protein [Chryseobacterium zhengzhouense]|uniref:DUF559 domain-containing protein n=1 Tax=Chryseobacterium zhengzhouense TaxID=1636086 RepID=A0ABW2LWS5_9FLAO
MKKIKKYNIDYGQYKSKLKIYNDELKIYKSQGKKEYNRYVRLQRIQNCINNSADYFQNKDYKQGYTHSFFKKVLTSRFGKNIYENLSLEKSSLNLIRDYYNDNNDREIDYYVTDFTYIKNNLKIDIEIDEPYSIKTRTPYHLNDSQRNKFFTDKNWVVIRFSESQIIEQSHECCAAIELIAEGILSGDLEIISKGKSFVRKERKWHEGNIDDLIKGRYREKCLQKFEILKQNPDYGKSKFVMHPITGEFR